MAKPKGPLVFEAHSAALLLPASLILPGLKHSSRAPAHPAVQQGCSVRREQCRLCFRRLCSHTVAEHHAQRTRRVQRITPASSPATGAAGCGAAGSTSRAGREARGISAGGEPRCWGSGRLPCAQGPAQPPARPRSTRVPAAPPAPPERGSWGAGRGRSAARIGRKVVTKFFVRALIGRGLQGCDPAAYARSAGCLGAAERAGIGIRIGAVRGCGAGRDGAGGRTGTVRSGSGAGGGAAARVSGRVPDPGYGMRRSHVGCSRWNSRAVPTLMSHQEGGKGAPPGSFVLSAALCQQRAFAQRPTQRAFVSARVSDSVSPLPAKPRGSRASEPSGGRAAERSGLLNNQLTAPL